jgi:hypothetical protein
MQFVTLAYRRRAFHFLRPAVIMYPVAYSRQ